MLASDKEYPVPSIEFQMFVNIYGRTQGWEPDTAARAIQRVLLETMERQNPSFAAFAKEILGL